MLEYHVSTWVLKVKTITILFMVKSQLIIPVFCQISGGSAWFRARGIWF